MENDFISGSNELLLKFLNELKSIPIKKREEEINRTVINMQGMLIFENMKNYFLQNGYNNKTINLYKNIAQNSLVKIKKESQKIIKYYKRIITISNSHTIFESIKNFEYEIIIMKSSPENEGKILYKKLYRINKNIKLIEDKKVFEYFNKSSIFICGCDGYDNEYFINKRGTKRVIDFALKNEFSVLVLSGEIKKINNLKKYKINKNFELIKLNKKIRLI